MNELELLIIEDDPRISEIQRRFVEKIGGFKVMGIAHNLAEAEDLIEVMQPRLVLLDIHFPDGSGLDLLRKIRQNEHPLDIILITAATEVSTLQEAMRGGVFDYILKPMVFERLQSSLTKYKDTQSALTEIEGLDQNHLDHLFNSTSASAQGSERLPKGIDPLSLDKVRQLFTKPSISLNAEQAGERVGASRTTARRYLEYLVSCNELKADLIYGAVGRPERIYQPV